MMQQARNYKRRRVTMLDGNPDQLLDVHDLAGLIGCSTGFVYRMVRDKEFPPSMHIGALSRWTARTYNEWVQARRSRQVDPPPTRQRKRP